MADMSRLVAQIDHRLADYHARLERVESHLRRGERRAARAEFITVLDELAEDMGRRELPMQMTLMAAQAALLGAPGPIFRGRLPAALLFGVGGWLAGHSVLLRYEERWHALVVRAQAIEQTLVAPVAPSSPT